MRTKKQRYAGGGMGRAVLRAALAATLGAATAAWAANRGAGFLFLEEPFNPRLVAMGSAGTGFAGPGFHYYNPAAAHNGGRSYLGVHYGRQSGDLQRGALEAGLAFDGWFAAVAVPTTVVSGIIPAMETGPNEEEPFSAQGTQLAVAAGWFNKRFAAALCLNGLQERISTTAGYGFSLSAGALCWILPGHLSAGAAAFHPNGIGEGSQRFRLGSTRGMLDASDSWGSGPLLPSSERMGIAWSDTLKGIGCAAALDLVVRNEDNRVMVPIGIEVSPLRFLAIRLGKRFNHDTELLNMGVGVRIAPVSADAAFVVSRFADDADFKWLVGVTYVLEQFRTPGTPAGR